jgi:Fur family ferric uptake transcriptional regulator
MSPKLDNHQIIIINPLSSRDVLGTIPSQTSASCQSDHRISWRLSPPIVAENEFHFQDAGWYPEHVVLITYPADSIPSAMLQKRIDDQPTISRQMVREAQEILHRHLKGVGLKQTAQRDVILHTFLETRDHLSTDELHRLVQKKDARIGYTTVYRTLKLLAECGLASEVAFHDGIARYEHQYNRRSHHHMVCTGCGSSVEFFSHQVGELEQEIGHKYHYVTTRHTFQIYGVCEDCRKKNHTQPS